MRRNTASTCRSHWTCNASAWLILLSLLFGVVWMAAAQQPPRRKTATKKPMTVKQGICGTVTVKRGNHMPMVDQVRQQQGEPVEREVLVYPLLSTGQIETGDNGFIQSVGTAKPLKTVKSAKDGTFCISLPAGRYTVLVREPQGLYANLFDGQGNVNPVTVAKDRLSQNKLEITHQAAF